MSSHPLMFNNNQFPAMRRIRRIHLIGIGGVGMSGIAEVLLNQGYEVSGSDVNVSVSTTRLRDLKATIYHGHRENHVIEVDVVVISSAIDPNNPELLAAKKARIPIISRAEMLAELMRFRYGIAITGTHGKTTTTSLVASLLAEGGFDPTFVIGGQLNSVSSNAKLGESRYFVAEADESDASFLYLQPMIAIVTNIDQDHMATYGHDVAKLKQTFIDFLHHLPFYGLAILCIDDPIIRELLPEIKRPVLTYGFHESADVRASNYTQIGLKSQFTVQFTQRHIKPLSITLNLPGRHNAANALAALALAVEEGVSQSAILNGFKHFAGIGRRFQMVERLPIKTGHVSLIDDYGHHPREVNATIEAIRESWPQRRLVLVFQLHRYTRTRDLFDDFVQILSSVDVLVMLPVYSAGEQPITGAYTQDVCRAIRLREQVVPIVVEDKPDLLKTLQHILHADDIVLMQGAGNIGQIAASIACGDSELIPEV